jgi:hypothetical protein
VHFSWVFVKGSIQNGEKAVPKRKEKRQKKSTMSRETKDLRMLKR